MVKDPSFGLSLLLVFTITAIFSQTSVLSSFTVPVELKKNANAVFRDHRIEITIEAVDKMVVKKKRVVTVLNKKGNVSLHTAKGL